MVPLPPEHLLVMFRPDVRYRGNYELDEVETRSVNHEIVAASTSIFCKRSGDDIAVHLEVPPKEPLELVDSQVEQFDDRAALEVMLRAFRPRSWWVGAVDAPSWPIPRWYTQ